MAFTQSFGRIPKYLERYKDERAEEEARWEAERRQERERWERMKLSEQEREGILQVCSMGYYWHCQ